MHRPAMPSAFGASGNALHPDFLTADERLTELGQLLGGALLRLRRRELERRAGPAEKNALDFAPARSLHATTGKRRRVAR